MSSSPIAPACIAPSSTPVGSWRVHDVAHPLWLCAFRSQFALTLLAATGLMLAWGVFLLLGWPLPAVVGGPFVWHGHELLLGLTLPALAGFVLTAVPEFTRTPAFGPHPARALVLLWLLGRLAFWGSGWLGSVALGVSALVHLLFLLLVLVLIAPRLWHDPGRQHLSFAWAVLLLGVGVGGFYADAISGQPPMRWLHGVLGVFMILMVIAISRISMRIVNDSIEEREAQRAAHGASADRAHAATEADTWRDIPRYLARPPRRHMAALCMGLFTAVQWAVASGWSAGRPVAAWLALASACAMFHLMGDWHVGRALLRRWPLMLYATYLCMAAGYGLMGLALLDVRIMALPPQAGMHVLTVGALGLGIYSVIGIAGLIHSGLEKDGRPWILMGAILLIASVILRLSAYSGQTMWYLGLSAALWCVAFGVQAWYMLPVFWRPRADGQPGCAGVQGADC